MGSMPSFGERITSVDQLLPGMIVNHRAIYGRSEWAGINPDAVNASDGVVNETLVIQAVHTARRFDLQSQKFILELEPGCFVATRQKAGSAVVQLATLNQNILGVGTDTADSHTVTVAFTDYVQQ